MVVLSSAAAVRNVMDIQGGTTGGRPRSLAQEAFEGLYMVLESAGVYTAILDVSDP